MKYFDSLLSQVSNSSAVWKFLLRVHSSCDQANRFSASFFTLISAMFSSFPFDEAPRCQLLISYLPNLVPLQRNPGSCGGGAPSPAVALRWTSPALP